MANALKFRDLFSELKKPGVISKHRRQPPSDSDTSVLSSEDITNCDPTCGAINNHKRQHLSDSDSSADSNEGKTICDPTWVPDNNEVSDSSDSRETNTNGPVTQTDVKTTDKPKAKRIRTQAAKIERDQDKHPVRPTCGCKRGCIDKIKAERRAEINKLFWAVDYNNRKRWIFSHVTMVPKRRPRLETKGCKDRTCSRLYKLRDEHGEDRFVCKLFFLNTLGYTCDKVITVTLKSGSVGCISPPLDQRGRHPPKHKMKADTMQLIEEHINSFNPSISHYRRAHAPHRKYLPPELSVSEMYNDFKVTHPGLTSYETYRTVIKKLNISFAKLGEEECEMCIMYEKHSHENSSDCQTCKDWRQHIESARISRVAYQHDVNTEHNTNEKYFSVDMQKVIMLPKLPGVKTCLFTKRLVLFHQTFAPLGGKRGGKCNAPTGIIWHEAISGRNAEDVTSAYSKIIHSAQYRDCDHFIFWVDNCTAQNKNWTLYTAMVNEVNRPGGPKSVTFKYLEKGHIFMSADSFHAQVEKGMRAERNLYDFDDFKGVVSKIGNAIELKYTDFRQWENGASQGKFTSKPLLSVVQIVTFNRGSTMMYWKTSLEQEEYLSGEFLKKKLSNSILRGDQPFSLQDSPRGIPTVKKADIIDKLCPLMPSNRIPFWKDLSVNDKVADLVDNE